MQYVFTSYSIARKLRTLGEDMVIEINDSDKLEIIRKQIQENLQKAYDTRAKYYNKRSRSIKYIPGQEVYKRNFVQSDFAKNVNAKLCRKFIKCRVVKPVGQNMYALETLDGKSLGVWHAKDIKQ